MDQTICGADCTQCTLQDSCGGCGKTGGRPFGKACLLAACCKGKRQESCGQCKDSYCGLREQILSELRDIKIQEIQEVKSLNALKGSFVNMAYPLPNGQTARFLDDNKIYLGNQVQKNGSDRCYGLAADEEMLLVCEYGEGGADPELIRYQKRRR